MSEICNRSFGLPGSDAAGPPTLSTSPPPLSYLDDDRVRSGAAATFSAALPLTTTPSFNNAQPWSLGGGHPLGGLRPPAVEDEDGNVLPRTSPSRPSPNSSPPRTKLPHQPKQQSPPPAAPSSPLPWGQPSRTALPMSFVDNRGLARSWTWDGAASLVGEEEEDEDEAEPVAARPEVLPSPFQTLHSALEESLEDRRLSSWHFPMMDPPSQLDVDTAPAPRSSAALQSQLSAPPSLHHTTLAVSPGGSGSGRSSMSDLAGSDSMHGAGDVPQLSDDSTGAGAGPRGFSMASDLLGGTVDSSEAESEDGCVPSLRLSRGAVGRAASGGNLFDKKRIRRSLSSWYNGKSKSFTSLSDASSVQGLRKPERWSAKRRRDFGLAAVTAARRSLVEEAESALAEDAAEDAAGGGDGATAAAAEAAAVSAAVRRFHTMDGGGGGLSVYAMYGRTIKEDFPLQACTNVEYAEF